MTLHQTTTQEKQCYIQRKKNLGFTLEYIEGASKPPRFCGKNFWGAYS